MNYKAITAALISLNLPILTSASAAEPLAGYIPSDVKQVCQISSDTFNNRWVKLSLPVGKDGLSIGPFYDEDSGIVYIFPADGPDFTTSGYADTDCAFFDWSAQMFLWLTSSVSSGEKPSTIHAPDDETSYVFSSEFLYRLNDGVLEPQSEEDETPTMQVRSAKGDARLTSIGQAGGEGVLFTQNQNNVSKSSSLVYYEVLTNRSYGYVRDAVHKSAPSPNNYSEFVHSATESCSAMKYGFDNGFVNNKDQTAAFLYNLFCPDNTVPVNGLPKLPTTISQLETAIDYLSMNMEIKIAWVDASTLNNPDNYITKKGVIPVYSMVDGKNEMLPMWTKSAELALVGMHVVGSVHGHPELVWATFEHKDNAPNAKYYYLDSDGSPPKSHSDTVNTANGNWLLSDGTAVASVTEYGRSEVEPLSSVDYIKPKSKTQIEPVSMPSQVNRINPWGNPQGKDNAKSNSAVMSTNISALSLLKQFYDTQGLSTIKDPRFNYILTGASWGADGNFPTGESDTNINGTPAMANTTLETFQQTVLQTSGDNTGCFGCHGITAGDSKFKVSHIFDKINQVEK